MELISFNSILQFNSICSTVNHLSKMTGVDAKNKPIYDQFLDSPILEVIGSEKIHGTNFSIAYNNGDGLWFQSRADIITPQKDNAGSAFFGFANKDYFTKTILALAEEYKIDLDKYSIVLSGEWAGRGIKTKSAVDGLEKQFYIFQYFKVFLTGSKSEDKNYYFEETKLNGNWIDNPDRKIFNIMNFPTYTLSIDFSKPRLHINEMLEIVKKVEESSPVGQYFGFNNNIGEGIVFSLKYKNKVLLWKVKGDAHSKSKVKVLKPVDDAKEQLKIDIAAQVSPAWRLEQMFDEANNTINGGFGHIDNISKFLKLVVRDIIKEESQLLFDNKLEIKDIVGSVNKIAKNWYLEQIDYNKSKDNKDE